MRLIDNLLIFFEIVFFIDLSIGKIILCDFLNFDYTYILNNFGINLSYLQDKDLNIASASETSVYNKTNYFSKLFISSLAILFNDTELLVNDKDWVSLVYNNEELINFFLKNLFSFSEMERLLKALSDHNLEINYFIFESKIWWLDDFEKRLSQNQLFHYYNNLFFENDVLRNFFIIFFQKNDLKNSFSIANLENFNLSIYIVSNSKEMILSQIELVKWFHVYLYEHPRIIFLRDDGQRYLLTYYAYFLCKNLNFYESYSFFSTCSDCEFYINDLYSYFINKINFFDFACISYNFNYLDQQNFNALITSKVLLDYVKITINFQLQFLEVMEVVFWKKMFNFLSNNLLLIGFMFLAVVALYKSINLIYALLSFLGFALLSGLLILLWGNEYLGLCVLLIYGAAIPVLALYIIMLINVDLIQWLFFYEKIVRYNFKVEFLALFFSFSIILSLGLLSNNSLFFFYHEWNYFIYSLLKYSFFLSLSWRFLNTSEISYSIDNVLDLTTQFFLTDIDKVAGAAFQSSYNELFSLVFLLLIAIIVVISISWVTKIKWRDRSLFYLNDWKFEKDIKDFYLFTITNFQFSVFWVDIDTYEAIDKDLYAATKHHNFVSRWQATLQNNFNIKHFGTMSKFKFNRVIAMLNDEYHFIQMFWWGTWLKKIFYSPVPLEYWVDYRFTDIVTTLPDLNISDPVYLDGVGGINELSLEFSIYWVDQPDEYSV